MNNSQNIIIVGNANPLLHVFGNAKVIANKFSDNMLEFLATGYSISQVTFVAFSLGAKAIAPLASRYITSKSSGAYVLPRLVGLDPGIVTNYEMHLVDGKLLNANDASFVMTVHTDCYDWGTIYAVGEANFWVNGGCKQPSCAAVFITNKGEFDGVLDELLLENVEYLQPKVYAVT